MSRALGREGRPIRTWPRLRPGDEVDDFLLGVAKLPSQVEQLSNLFVYGCAEWRVGRNSDAATAAEFQDAIVAEHAQGSQHSVGVDVEYRCQVTSGWQTFTRCDFSVRDRTPDF